MKVLICAKDLFQAKLIMDVIQDIIEENEYLAIDYKETFVVETAEKSDGKIFICLLSEYSIPGGYLKRLEDLRTMLANKLQLDDHQILLAKFCDKYVLKKANRNSPEG